MRPRRRVAIPEVKAKFEAQGDIANQTGPELASEIKAQIERLQGWSKPWVKADQPFSTKLLFMTSEPTPKGRAP